MEMQARRGSLHGWGSRRLFIIVIVTVIVVVGGGGKEKSGGGGGIGEEETGVRSRARATKGKKKKKRAVAVAAVRDVSNERGMLTLTTQAGPSGDVRSSLRIAVRAAATSVGSSASSLSRETALLSDASRSFMVFMRAAASRRLHEWEATSFCLPPTPAFQESKCVTEAPSSCPARYSITKFYFSFSPAGGWISRRKTNKTHWRRKVFSRTFVAVEHVQKPATYMLYTNHGKSSHTL